MKYRIILCICLLCVLFIGFGNQAKPVFAAGTVYYVATTGSDTNGNGSLSNPWATIQKAANMMVPGGTCYIEAGTYGRLLCNSSGTLGNYITFENYNNGIVNINGGTAYDDIDTNGYDYLQFIGLNCIGTTTFGIDFTGSGYVTIQNCSFSDCASSGIHSVYTVQSNNITVNGCTCSGTNTAANEEAISLANVNNFVVENCVVENTVATGRSGIDAKNGCSNGSIHNNTVDDVTANGIYIDAEGKNTSNISVYDNIIENCTTSSGIQLYDENGTATLTNINFYNNIILGCQRGFSCLYNSKENYNFTFINNTLYNDGTNSEIWVQPPSTNLTSCVIENNILENATTHSYGIEYNDYAHGGITINNNLEYNSGGAWASGNIFGTAYITSNPLLGNSTSNFQLQASSPCIGTGSSTGAPTLDYAAVTRASPPCIGAYEYETTFGSSTVATTSASNITLNGATLNGSLTTIGSANSITVSFDWGLDTNYTGGNVSAILSLVSGSPTPFTANLSGLNAGTTYHYRAEAVSNTVVYGTDQQFTTSPYLPTLEVTTNSLANGTAGMAYSQTMEATGGMAPYTWTIASGMLPLGLSFSSSGVISGTPTTGGPTSVSFKVTDTNGTIATQSLTINIVYVLGDINKDGAVNVLDMILVTQHFGETGTPGWIPEDLKNYGIINVLDCIIMGQHWTG